MTNTAKVNVYINVLNLFDTEFFLKNPNIFIFRFRGQYMPESLQQFFRSSISFVQNSTVSAIQWCSNLYQLSKGK